MALAIPLVAAFIMTLSVILLTVATGVLIPQFVPENDQEDAEHWTLVSYSLFMMVFSMAIVEINTRSVINFAIFTFLIAFQIISFYWWIPSYVPQQNRKIAIHWLFIASSLAVALTNLITTVTVKTGMYAVEAGWGSIPPGQQLYGGRRR
jgi:hypothetical protein